MMSTAIGTWERGTASAAVSRVAAVLGLGLLACTPALSAQTVSQRLEDPEAANVAIVGHVVEPEQIEPTAERIARLRMPAGFTVSVFARDLVNPRMMAVADDGTVYVTRRTVGDVMMLRDTDGDGVADQQRVVASRPNMHGIAITGSTMYLVTIKDLYRTQIRADGTLGPLEHLVDDLPDAGQHPNRTVVVGPDGMLYLSVGSTCNACSEANPENATMLRVSPDGTSRTIYATGLRNTIGFGFAPGGGALFGMDHGIDWLGDNEQHEELNQIVEGAKYGWPYIYADGKYNPQDEPPGGISMAEWAARSARPLGLYTPHAAPMQMAFYTADRFPQEYRGDAFVAMRGSWNRERPSGYEVMRIRFQDGRPVGLEPFVTGFLVQEGGRWGYLARLAGLAQARDGSLLLSDDANGIIYRIAYQGAGAGGAAGGPGAPTNVQGARVGMTDATAPRPPADTPAQLASALLGGSDPSLRVTSPAFANDARIPETYGAEGQNVSPPLQWSAGPAGTRSYAVLMEDPDVERDPPFVHWLLYNVPADVTSLDEAVPGAPRLQKPRGALQGRNERGSVGYFGPRPPKSDPPHHYHFQVFALDTVLDLPHGASRAELLAAMRGHVLAQGRVVGTFER